MNLSSIPSDYIEDMIVKRLLNKYGNQFKKYFIIHEKSNDPEALHQIRVNSRRLLNVFFLFANEIPVKIKNKWHKEIKRFLTSLNQIRDNDVQLLYLNNLQNNNVECKGIIKEITQYIRKQNRKLEKKLSEFIKEFQKKAIVDDILEFSTLTDKRTQIQLSPSNNKKLGITSLKKTTPFLKEFTKKRPFIVDSRKVTELHESRLLIKKVRYSLEILKQFFPLLNKPFKIAEKLQDILGKIHDCDIWIEFLDSFSKHLDNKKTQYSIEQFNQLSSELKQLKMLRIAERRIKHKQLVTFLKKNNNLAFETQITKSF